MSPSFRHAIAALLLVPTALAQAAPGPPATRVEVVRDTLHGTVIEDPYRWLENKDAPETRQWVREQMAYTQSELAKVPGRDDVKERLGRYMRVETRSTPVVRGRRLFFMARRADQQQPVLTMRDGASGTDVPLIDPNPMSPDHSTSIALLDVSLDGTMLAYGIRKGGEDETDLHLFDLASRGDAPGGLPKARYFGVTIDPQKKGLWYGRWEPKGSRVWYHRIGDDPAKDALVYGDTLGPTEIPSPRLSENGRWLAIVVSVGSSGDLTRVFLRDAAKAGGAFTPVTDTLHASVALAFAGDALLLTTNWNAPNRRVMIADPKHPGIAQWREIVAERRDAVIEQVDAIAGRVVVRYLHNVSSEFACFSPDGKALGAIALPGIGTARGLDGEWNGSDAYFTFESLNRPPTIFRHDFAASATTAWWTSPIAFDADRYDVRPITFLSKDGTKVPMFVVQPKNFVYDGSHPVLMTGYGGFNVSMTPAFSPMAAAWLEMGGVYVLTNLRGGSEFGENWHRAGMLGNKQHVFDDFEFAAQWLITHGYCPPAKLAIMGGSNGGLLVGAAMTQRPDLFGAVVCQVPLLDMLRYQQFLVARFWVPEYGSAENPEQFRWLAAYSPYQHVKAGVKYPPVMFVTGDSDTRVDPLHARKMAARMQALGGESPVLLHYDVSSGHAGGKSVDKSIEDNADVLQFLRGRLGMAGPVN